MIAPPLRARVLPRLSRHSFVRETMQFQNGSVRRYIYTQGDGDVILFHIFRYLVRIRVYKYKLNEGARFEIRCCKKKESCLLIFVSFITLTISLPRPYPFLSLYLIFATVVIHSSLAVLLLLVHIR